MLKSKGIITNKIYKKNEETKIATKTTRIWKLKY